MSAAHTLKTLVASSLIASALLAGGTALVSAEDMKSHASMAMSASDAPSTQAFKQANMAMHKKMDIEYTGRPDVDFVRGMIPHHEGAIAMARIELEHGKDPEIRKLAEAVIKAQEAEIAEMKAWLAKNDK
ncbi:DUF305 domain-containing protein [Xaviernesmea oryzae]|uniref:DUF305 domain-containing protein n=1 Tax=Xaviernesmea oryzae TaxID=464029 RepID=A0A1Q9ASJ1_9HYPH|nr:DUF305 domain-containing protein [Xaviernesmea oryzae]OLP58356.1 DUF305 domain-containing protein [Xaviernesmea oryzae]SEL84309.1 protein of unknown function [Xaviernesmea oryzae]